jgi:hypothetical protein
MTGSVNALEAVKKIVQYLDEELEVVRHKRKNPLLVLQKWTPLEKLENGTALIAFSRAEVLKLKQKLQKKYSVSVIYGNLSPEVRRDEGCICGCPQARYLYGTGISGRRRYVCNSWTGCGKDRSNL